MYTDFYMIKYQRAVKVFLLLCMMTSPVMLRAGEDDYRLFNENGKQGIQLHTGEIIVPAKYDELGWSDAPFSTLQGVVGYRIENTWGLLTIKNNQLTAPVYSHLNKMDAGSYIIAAKRDNITQRIFWSVIDQNGREFVPFKYSKIKIVNDRVIAWFPSGNNVNKVGMLDLHGDEIIPFTHLSLKPLGDLRYLAETADGKLRIYSDAGEHIRDLEFDSLSVFNNGLARVYSNHKVGLLNREGEIVVEPQYGDIRIGDEIMARNYPEWQRLEINNRTSGNYRYDVMQPVTPQIFKVTANGSQWLIDITRDSMVTTTVFNEIGAFENGYAIVRKEKKYGVIRQDGKWLLPLRYNEIIRNDVFLYVLENNGLWNIYDYYGVKKNRVPYEAIGSYKGLLFSVKQRGYWGFINREGREVINCVFDSVGAVVSRHIAVQFKGLYGAIDIDNNWVVVPAQGHVTIVNNELYLRKVGRQTLVMNYNDEIVYFTDNELEIESGYFLEHLSDNNVWKIDFSGVIRLEKVSNILDVNKDNYSPFEEIRPPSEGFIGIKKDGRYGFIDEQNRLRIANRYEDIGRFKEGFAAIKILDRWGFVDVHENLVIQPVFDEVEEFNQGICVVRQNGKYLLINKAGKALFQKGFDTLTPGPEGRYLVTQGERYGLIDHMGNALVSVHYDFVEDLDNGYVIISKLGKYGVVDLQGVNIVPRKYNAIIYYPDENVFYVRIDSDWKPIDL